MDNGQHREMPADGAINDGQTSDHLAGAGDLQWREIARAVQEAGAVEAVGAPMGQLLAAPHMGQLLAAPQQMQPLLQMQPRPQMQQPPPPPMLAALQQMQLPPQVGALPQMGAPPQQMAGAPAGGWQYSGGIVLPFQLDGRVAHLDEL